MKMVPLRSGWERQSADRDGAAPEGVPDGPPLSFERQDADRSPPRRLREAGPATTLDDGPVARLPLARRTSSAPVDQAADGRARLLGKLETHGRKWYWECDARGTLTYLSPQMRRLLDARGVWNERVRLVDILQSAQLDLREQSLDHHLGTQADFGDVEVRIAGITEERTWLLTGYACRDGDKRFCGYAGTGTDLTEEAWAAKKAAQLALCDALTGLANRTKMDALLAGIFTGGRGRYCSATLMMVDLDRFKQVNDTFGHPVGDALLAQVADRLKHAVGDAGVAARFGGDEFQVLLPDETRHDLIARLAQRIIRGLSRPFKLAGQTITIGASIGVAIAPEHAACPQDLLRNADLALYSAKSTGPNQIAFYRDSMLEAARDKKMLEEDLRQAIQKDQLTILYQPIVSAADEHIAGYEALLRWTHPERGPISPTVFIPIAEECGLIGTIGAWVLATACGAASLWPDSVRIAVNVSPAQITDPRFPDLVQDILRETGLAAGRLELEITESVLLESQKETEAIFERLAVMGVGLALDDFGTGYSSLTYLKNAPYRKIKIDQSFVRDGRDPDSKDRAIISAITRLARNLGIETVAEGVEEEQDFQLVQSLDVSHIQGFIYGRLRTAEEVLRFDTHGAPLPRKRPGRKKGRFL